MLLSPAPHLASVLERPILLFGGKGGVGKTTLAAATAVSAADAGRTTLLVSTDPAHSTADVLGVPLGPEPQPVLPGLDAVELDPGREADRYIAEVKTRVAEVAPARFLSEVERQIDLARVTPGAEEAALFDRFTRILEEGRGRYRHLVFDTAPLGHTLRLVTLPEQMTRWVEGLLGRRRKVGALQRMWRRVSGDDSASDADDPALAALLARRDRFVLARSLLRDPRIAGFVMVLLPERLSVLETGRAAQALADHRIPVAALLVNRVIPEGAGGTFLADLRGRQREQLERIEEDFSTVPVFQAPFLREAAIGPDRLRALASRVAPAAPVAGLGVPGAAG